MDTINDNLSLTVINDGNGSQCGLDYKGRCALAMDCRNPNSWTQLVNKANNWMMQRGYEGAKPSEILDQAAKVAAYYEEHVKELFRED